MGVEDSQVGTVLDARSEEAECDMSHPRQPRAAAEDVRRGPDIKMRWGVPAVSFLMADWFTAASAEKTRGWECC